MSSNSSLHEAIVASQNFFFRSMAISCYESEGIIATTMGINNAFFNNVLETNIAATDVTSIIQKLIIFFAKYDAPWTWLVYPFSKPIELGTLLESNGMTKIEDFSVMGIDITKALPVISDNCLCIKEVLSARDFDDWNIPEHDGFGGTEEVMMQFRRRTENIPYGNGNNFHHYVLYVDSNPVAAGTLSLHQGNARLDNIAVRPAYQKNGFGTAITLHMLTEAKRFGVKHCFLDASHHGKGVYIKLGFQEYYTGEMYGFLPENERR